MVRTRTPVSFTCMAQLTEHLFQISPSAKVQINRGGSGSVVCEQDTHLENVRHRHTPFPPKEGPDVTGQQEDQMIHDL